MYDQASIQAKTPSNSLLETEIKASPLVGKWSNYKVAALATILKQELYLLSTFSSYMSTQQD